MDHGQVAVQTDAAQEADADVDVLIEQKATQLAQPFPVLPVVILQVQEGIKNGRPLNIHIYVFFLFTFLNEDTCKHTYKHNIWMKSTKQTKCETPFLAIFWVK